MPNLIIDNRHVEVPRGTTVIDAAERLGIMIPRFCYLKVLGAVGACRMCAVMFEAGPVKGLQMSCMVQAADGMKVSTTHPEAVAFRRQIIEWLMINHPHDCPVCDEGGHCLLQDETISGGHSRRRFTGSKRTYPDQDLGPLVQHEMNRCIQCYRCVRFYQEYAGYRDLGVMGIASRIYYGRFSDGALESPFSGNLIDICPTGVYTDKPSRFLARRWDLQRADSICLHCSLGCNTVAGAHYRAVIRQESRENSRVNGSFICDRGRYGHAYANLADRPRQARLADQPAGWQEAAQEAAARLKRIAAAAGHSAIAVLGSARNSLETQIMLRYLSHHAQWRPPQFFVNESEARTAAVVVSRLDSRLAAGLPDLEEADFLVAVGVDPVHDAPMLAMAMRQAARQGAKIVVLDPRPVELPFAFELLSAAAGELGTALAVLIKTAVSLAGAAGGLGAREKAFLAALPDGVPDERLQEKLLEAGRRLADRQRPAVICGTAIAGPELAGLAADLTLLLQAGKAHSRLFYTLPGANAFGAGLLQRGSRFFPSLLRDIEKGEVRALLVVENDLFFRYPDQNRLRSALGKLELLVVLDYLASPTVQAAHIFLPGATVFEAGGSFINNCGLLQYAAPVHEGGIPLVQLNHGSHPPRSYAPSMAFAACPSAYEALLLLAGELAIRPPTTDASPWSLLPEDYPDRAQLLAHPYPTDGLQLLPQLSEADPLQTSFHPPAAGPAQGALTVLLVERTFGTEELSCHSEPLRQLAGQPLALLHSADAERAGVRDGDHLQFAPGWKKVDLQLRVTNRMAPGQLIIPHHYAQGQAASRLPAVVSHEELQRLAEQYSRSCAMMEKV
jgi:NADH-quinone oxidoreductase subunit G